MITSETKEIIKSIIKSFLPDMRVLLFSSMVRGDFKTGSDYDIMIITQNTFGEKEKITWRSRVRKALIKALHAPVDLLINSEEEIIKKRKLPEHVVQYALDEGVVL